MTLYELQSVSQAIAESVERKVVAPFGNDRAHVTLTKYGWGVVRVTPVGFSWHEATSVSREWADNRVAMINAAVTR